MGTFPDAYGLSRRYMLEEVSRCGAFRRLSTCIWRTAMTRGLPLKDADRWMP